MKYIISNNKSELEIINQSLFKLMVEHTPTVSASEYASIQTNKNNTLFALGVAEDDARLPIEIIPVEISSRFIDKLDSSFQTDISELP